MTNFEKNLERFDKIKAVVEEKKEKHSKLTVELKYKKEELGNKAQELKDSGIEFKSVAELSEIFKESEENIEKNLDKLEKMLGMEEDKGDSVEELWGDFT